MLAPGPGDSRADVIILAAAIGADGLGPRRWGCSRPEPGLDARVQAVTILEAQVRREARVISAEAFRTHSFSTALATGMGQDARQAERRVLEQITDLLKDRSGLLVTLGGHELDLPEIRLGCYRHLLSVPHLIGATNRGIDLCEVLSVPSYEWLWTALTGKREAVLERAHEHAESKAFVGYLWLLRYMVANRIASQEEYERSLAHFVSELVQPYWENSLNLQERLGGLFTVKAA